MMKMYNVPSKDKEKLDVVYRMARMAEYREGDITDHLGRIRGYCYVLASGLGVSQPEAEAISYASMLHDIGKSALPDAILLKRGDLTPYEWEYMTRHTVLGAEILRGSTSAVLQAGEIIALTHHERWDGSGYPKGLRGEDIPLSGRICALADVFDALTTPRAYKKEMPVPLAEELIRDASGQLFDPQLVRIFIKEIDSITKIRNSHLSI
jgi:putative two-component system response regulator